MATCDIQTIISQACSSGFKCLNEEQYRALVLQLLCNVSESVEPAFLTYVAKISSNGSNAPIVSVMENTIGNIAWSRQAAGVYRGILAGALPSTRTVGWISHNPLETGSHTTGFYIYCSSNMISIEIFEYDADGIGTGTDGEMDNASLEIRVYPA